MVLLTDLIVTHIAFTVMCTDLIVARTDLIVTHTIRTDLELTDLILTLITFHRK